MSSILQFSNDDIMHMEQRYRTSFINSLSGYKSANLLGTADGDGHSNLCVISSCFHVGANPPLIGMLMRPHVVPRHSLENIKATGWYTLNHFNQDIVEQAHQTSARYPKEVSEFDACGFTETYHDPCPAPAVAESKVSIMLKVESIQLLDINQTELVIGSVVSVVIKGDHIDAGGRLDLESLGTLSVSGLDKYHRGLCVAELPYAKVVPVPQTEQ